MRIDQYSSETAKNLTRKITFGGMALSTLMIAVLLASYIQGIAENRLDAIEDNVKQSLVTGDTFQLGRIAASMVEDGKIASIQIESPTGVDVESISRYEPASLSEQFFKAVPAHFSFTRFISEINSPKKIGQIKISVLVPLLPIGILLLGIGIIWFILSAFVRSNISKLVAQIQRPISELHSYIQKADPSADLSSRPERPQVSLDEINEVIDEFENTMTRAENYRKQAIQLEREATIGQIATQVRHDALQMIMVANVGLKDLEGPEKDLFLVRSAVERFEEIILDIPRKCEVPSALAPSAVNTEPGRQSLTSLIQPVVDQVSALAKERNLPIIVTSEVHCPDLEVSFDKIMFERSLLNLVLNSMEAIEPTEGGEIRIRAIASGLGDQLEIEITDTGKGIPSDIIPKLGIKGASFGKKGGLGLGLFSVKSFLDKNFGVLFINSASSSPGTTVSMKFELPQ